MQRIKSVEAGPALVDRTRRLLCRRLSAALGPVGPVDPACLLPGKMLRTRLAGSLLDGDGGGADLTALEHGCAAVEMVHTASLCHDDVIDGALIRRSLPTLWRQTGPSAAVLIGDILLCEALELMAGVCSPPQVFAFLAAVKETCAAEAEHELLRRRRDVDIPTSLRLARGKTGALFAFAAGLCGQDDAQVDALREAGYQLGTAYQLADDVLDRRGRQDRAGKTLGTDAARHKTTLASLDEPSAIRHAGDGCAAAMDALAPWPALRAGLAGFVERHLQPLWRDLGLPLLTDSAGEGR